MECASLTQLRRGWGGFCRPPLRLQEESMHWRFVKSCPNKVATPEWHDLVRDRGWKGTSLTVANVIGYVERRFCFFQHQETDALWGSETAAQFPFVFGFPVINAISHSGAAITKRLAKPEALVGRYAFRARRNRLGISSQEV